MIRWASRRMIFHSRLRLTFHGAIWLKKNASVHVAHIHIYIGTSSIFVVHFYFPASGRAVVTGVDPSPPRFLPSLFYRAHRVQQSHCARRFLIEWVLLTHALALSASQFVHKKKPLRIYTSMHSGGLELMKVTYTRLDDNLIQ